MGAFTVRQPGGFHVRQGTGSVQVHGGGRGPAGPEGPEGPEGDVPAALGAAVADELNDTGSPAHAALVAAAGGINDPSVAGLLASASATRQALGITSAGSGGFNLKSIQSNNIIGTGTGTANTIAGGGTTNGTADPTPNLPPGSTFINAILGTMSAGVSVIGGGYDNVQDTIGAGANTMAGGAHHRIVGNTDHGTIGGGSFNKHTNSHYGTIAGGTGNENSNDYGAIAGGNGNKTTGSGGAVPGGTNNEARGTNSVAMGQGAISREANQVALGCQPFSVAGDAQTSWRTIKATTTNATTTSMQVALNVPLNSATLYQCMVIAHDVATGDAKGWIITGIYRREAGTTVTQVGGTPTATVVGTPDAGASSWGLSALNGTGTISLRVTGEASKTIRWVARVTDAMVA